MNRIFKPRGFFVVPDGTEVSPFLNATESNQPDVPPGLLGDASIAAGKIGPGVHSWVHVHPAVSQATYMVAGRELIIRMKQAGADSYYDLPLNPGAAVVSEPGTLFQLRNDSKTTAEVLYIVSPSYVFEMEGEKIVYDDSIMVTKTWDELEAAGYDVAPLHYSLEERDRRRKDSIARLYSRK